ncbi:translational activator of GCN4, partial [Coemansia helicoidea]
MSEETARDVAFSWKAQLGGLSGRIAVSGVNSRCAALEDELVQLIAEHPLEDKELVAVLATLKRTIGLYVDRASRAAVLTVLRRLAAAKPQVFAKAVAAVLDPVVEGLQPKKTAHPDAIPSPLAPRFVLLPWITLALTVPVSLAGAKPADLPGDAAWKRLVTLAARLLWGIAPARPGGSDTKAASMSRSAHCEVWRMLRGAPELIQPMLAVLTADADTGEAAVVLVGNIVSTATRLGTADALQAVEAAKDAIVGMIDRVLVNAKTPVSYSSVADLGDFLRGHVGSEFDGRFRASISKMLVRAPECVLPTCLWLLQALGSDSVDVSAMYLEVFADPLASNMLKSTNASVRGAAVDLLAHLSGTPATEEAATAAAQILIKPMEQGRYTQPEQRVAAYTLLGGVHAGPDNGWASSVVILPALVRMAARETQEEPVAALFAAIGAHFRAIADQLDAAASDTASAAYKQCEAAVCEFADAAAKGLALPDRSAVVRHAWVALALGEPLWGWAAAGDRTAHPWMKAHVAPLVQALAKTAEKAAADPLAAPTSLLDAHVGLALALRLGPALAPEAIDAGRLVALVSGREKSLVLWDKAYHKCTRASEGAWVLRSARMLFAGGCRDPRLGELLIWAICHPASPALETTRAALGVLADMSRAEPARLWQALSPALFAGMTAALNGSEPGCDWPAVISAAAAGVLAAKAPSEAVSSLLVAMALACHHPAVVGALGRSSLWISLVQRAGVDPAELCCSHLPALKQSVREAMAGEFGGAAFEAATHLIRDLVLIGGGSVAGQLLEFAHQDIDPAVLGSITDEDIAIWRSPAGQLYFDPIQAKEKAAAGRGGGKGNKADAWAEQLQAEVARKKNQAPKLSKLEQELVAKQEAKESAARERVGTAHAGLRRGLALVRAVVGSGAGGVSDVMLDVVRVVVERAIVGGAAASETLAGSDILATVELMAAAADGLPEALRLPVAMGLLRARGLEAVVPAGWRQESMEDLATRVYFRLRMSCEATPLPPAGFNFLLAFMQATADAGGWGRKAKKGIEEHDEYAQLDHASEQLTMVVDLLSFHAHFGYMAEMPRKEMLALMIQLMAAHPMLLAACRASMVKMAGEMEGSDTPLERDVLIGGLGQPDSVVRNACLAALDFADLTEMDYSASVWLNAGGSGTEVVALEENAELAAALWADNSMEVQIGLIADVIPFLKDRSAEIRNCAARAIGNAAETL